MPLKLETLTSGGVQLIPEGEFVLHVRVSPGKRTTYLWTKAVEITRIEDPDAVIRPHWNFRNTCVPLWRGADGLPVYPERGDQSLMRVGALQLPQLCVFALTGESEGIITLHGRVAPTPKVP